MGPTHSLVALTGAVVIASTSHASYTEAGILIGGSVATAKLPDIDQHIAGIEHRGPVTHGLFTGLLYAVALLAIGASIDPIYGPLAVAGMAIGWLLHPIPDNMTKTGTRWLWPFVRHEIHFLPKPIRFYTGTPDRVCSRCGKSKCRCLFARRRCKRCRKSVRACWCGKPELAFRAALLAGLLGFLWMTYGT